MEQVRQARDMLSAIRYELSVVDKLLLEAERKNRKSPADYFLPTLAANVDNDKLTDAEFREFVRNSIKGMA